MMNLFARRAVIVAVGGVATITLAAGPAAAHFCYKSWETAQSAAGKAGSANWMSFHDLAAMFVVDVNGQPICDAGIQALATAGGVTTDTMINTHGTMAGGTLRKAEPGTKSISYLNFEALDAATPGAYTLCGQTPPPME